jgi:hypothetical protein
MARNRPPRDKDVQAARAAQRKLRSPPMSPKSDVLHPRFDRHKPPIVPPSDGGMTADVPPRPPGLEGAEAKTEAEPFARDVAGGLRGAAATASAAGFVAPGGISLRGEGRLEVGGPRVSEGVGRARASQDDPQLSSIKNSHNELLALAVSLEHLAREGIKKLQLDNDSRNDPTTIEHNNKQIELLTILADGFAQIAAALNGVAKNPDEPVFLGRAAVIVNAVGEQFQNWLLENAAEAADWGIRLPVMIASIATFGWAGANMTIATTAVTALVGGQKVINALKRPKKSD